MTTPQPGDKPMEIKTEQEKIGDQGELPSSLHFQEIPAGSGPATPQNPAEAQAALGEVELPSSIRFFDTNKGGATPREPAMEEQAKRKLNTLVEVSESQSLSDTQKKSVQQDFQAYLSFRKSQEQGKIEELSGDSSEQCAHKTNTHLYYLLTSLYAYSFMPS